MYPVTIGFFMILSFDLILNAHYSITKYYDFSKEDVNTVEYYDDYCTLLSEIKRTVYEDDGRDGAVFRMDKLFRMHNNDAMLVSYNGLSHFSSTESSSVLDFMSKLGFCSNNMWSYYGEEGNTSFADSFLGVKYMISQYDTTEKPYERINIIDEKYIFRNPYAL